MPTGTLISSIPQIGNNMAHTVYKNKAGTRLPSCTTVIGKNLGWNKDALTAWTRKLCLKGIDTRKIKEAAGEIGTLTHKMIEHHIYSASIDVAKYSFEAIAEATNGLRSYKEWEHQYLVEYLESELAIISEKYQFGGTADGIIKIGQDLQAKDVIYPAGSTLLLDFKTSSGIYPDHIIQISAYKTGVEEVYPQYKLDGSIVVHIKKGDIEAGEERISVYPIPKEKLELGWKVFQHLRAVHGAQKELVL